jgi:exopolysaccharide biosynthesis polyprenyl glycosylphosphotransferase
VTLRHSTNGTNLSVLEVRSAASADRTVLNEEAFHRMISLERKRSERSRKPFLLTLVDTGTSLPAQKNGKVLQKILAALSTATRETDVTGWYKNSSVIGVMFTEITTDDKYSIVSTMLERISSTLRENLTSEQFSQISLSFHVFPEEWTHELSHRPSNPVLYPDLSRREESKRLCTAVKRTMDVVGSLMALTILSPLFLLIALAIKLTSEGPIFFRQQRVGQHGRSFIFLKFRSMKMHNDTTVHKEWFNKFVSGKAERKPVNGSAGVFKMMDDPRITPVGRWLRRTSLDELPQFINVLRGDMALVGPRPPIPYEVEAYQTWHRRRILEAKPGITGLWQVNGRSRVTFDEMVRLDLRYARTWSLWLDIKILLQTPKAVLLGEGAY